MRLFTMTRKFCRICNQSLNGQIAYCSAVCSGLAKGNAQVLVGSYWGIDTLNQRKEVATRLTNNH